MATKNHLLREIQSGGTVKDYKHAARIFLDANYRLAPKNAFLFHVAFDIDVSLSMQAQEQILEAGLLVKRATLPQFTIENKIYNAYNRANVVQTKVKYNSVDIDFHDDNADVVRDFWYNYYNYYYRDSDTNLVAQNAPHKYQERITDSWGYNPRLNSATPKILRSVRIYVLHQQRFTEYLLVNPIITKWSGSVLDVAESTGTVESKMTIDYEAVIFSSGLLIEDNEDNVPSFKLKYDKVASDITPGPVGFDHVLPTPLSLPDQIKNGYKKIVAATGEFANAARDIRNTVQQAQQFKKDVRAFQTGIQDFKNFGKYIAQGSNPFAQIRVPDLTNLTRGIAQADGQLGRAVGMPQGILGGLGITKSLTASSPAPKAGSVTSNQAPVSSAPQAPGYWTSTVDGARPPLPSLPRSGRAPVTTEQLNAARSTNPGNVESAIVGSGYSAGTSATQAKNLFTNSKNLQNDQTVSNIVDKLDAAALEQQEQRAFVEKYMNSTNGPSPDSEDNSEWYRGS